MKMHQFILSIAAAGTLVLFGCGKSDHDHAHGHVHVDPAPVEKSFASAEPDVKATADKAVAAIKKENYSAALADLQALASNAKLTDDQKKAVSEVLANLQKALTDAGAKAAGEAGKALDGVQKSLGK